MALSTHTKSCLDALLGHGAAAKLVTACNGASATGIDRDLRGRLEHALGGIGEANAFITALTGNGTLSIAAQARLEHVLHGRGNVADLQTAITGGSA